MQSKVVNIHLSSILVPKWKHDKITASINKKRKNQVVTKYWPQTKNLSNSYPSLENQDSGGILLSVMIPQRPLETRECKNLPSSGLQILASLHEHPYISKSIPTPTTLTKNNSSSMDTTINQSSFEHHHNHPRHWYSIPIGASNTVSHPISWVNTSFYVYRFHYQVCLQYSLLL